MRPTTQLSAALVAATRKPELAPRTYASAPQFVGPRPSLVLLLSSAALRAREPFAALAREPTTLLAAAAARESMLFPALGALEQQTTQVRELALEQVQVLPELVLAPRVRRALRSQEQELLVQALEPDCQPAEALEPLPSSQGP